MLYSFVIPVYNRPDEINELLESLARQQYNKPFEVVVVEDGSSVTCKHIVEQYNSLLDIQYYFKENSGPGASRNFGMRVARGAYFIILDSDCILPPGYLGEVDRYLEKNYVDCFGGPDAAHTSFSDIQKAINQSMTSFLTTGGVRGGSEKLGKFQPRSFNMGLSRKAFEASGGFGKIHPGEDPDLSIRLWKMHFRTDLIPDAFVFHKRRIDWKKFYRQVHKFGKARPILNQRYPEYRKVLYWFPSVFIIGFAAAFLLLFFKVHLFIYLYIFYFAALFVESIIKTRTIKISFLTLIAAFIQFTGYGTGFLYSHYLLNVKRFRAETAMPEMFFK